MKRLRQSRFGAPRKVEFLRTHPKRLRRSYAATANLPLANTRDSYADSSLDGSWSVVRTTL